MPVAAWVATRRSGPPALATFLPAFWLLVPGAVGLIGVAEFVGSDREAGLDHFVNAGITFIAIGLGVLVGNALVLRWQSIAKRRPSTGQPRTECGFHADRMRHGRGAGARVRRADRDEGGRR